MRARAQLRVQLGFLVGLGNGGSCLATINGTANDNDLIAGIHRRPATLHAIKLGCSLQCGIIVVLGRPCTDRIM